MKKIKFLLVSLVSIFAFNVNVFAASGNLSVSSGSVYVGDSFTVTANVSSAAAWNVHVSASGPVSGCSINQADATADAMDTSKSFSATCTATGEGTITIRLSGDVTSASDGNAVNISGSKSVSVTTKPAPPSNNNNNNNNSNNNNNNTPRNNNNNHSNNNNQATDNRSKNNNLKELSVDGYDLVKVDDNNYSLTVTNDISNISIKATAEDGKAKVSGTGNHELKVGDNNLEVIVTAENGSQNKINIKITRKDGYYLEDLDAILKNDKIDDINITISQDTKITSQELEKIKNSKKTVKLNYYNNDKILMYSWIIDGSKLKNTHELLTTISSESSNKKNILIQSNYADGLFLELKQGNNLPNGTKIKIYVGDKYSDNDLVNIYSYNKTTDKLSLVKNKVKVENGYVEFEIADESDYFITMTTVNNAETSSINIFMIISIVEFILLILLLALDFMKINPIYKIKKK